LHGASGVPKVTRTFNIKGIIINRGIPESEKRISKGTGTEETCIGKLADEPLAELLMYHKAC